MFCKKCGFEIPEDSSFCPKCGKNVEISPEDSESASQPRKIDIETAEIKNVLENHNEDRAQLTEQTVQKTTYTGKRKKSKLFIPLLFIAISLLIIAILLASVLTTNQEPQDQTAETATEEPANTTGTTPLNIMAGGIATIQNDTIYYADSDIWGNTIMTMDTDGENKQELYANDNIFAYELNIIGKQLFYIANKCDGDGQYQESDIVYINTDEGSPKPIYTSDNYLIGLYVSDNKIYCRESDDEGNDEIISMNTDGSDVQTVMEKDGYIYNFSVIDSYFYYVYNDHLYRSDLTGENATKLADGPIYRYCLDDTKIYVSEYNNNGCMVIKSMDLDGGNSTQIAEFESAQWIEDMNIQDDILYYTNCALDDDLETQSCDICAMNTDGSGQKILASVSDDVSGLGVCGHYLFYWLSDSGKIKSINLNAFTEN